VTVYLGSAFDQTGRKVLVIFTDGDDTSSSRRWDETVRLLRASDVTVYPIGFLSNRGSPRLTLQSKLMEIARLTGGRAMFPGTMKELEPMYAAIAAEIEGQYVIGYVPTNVARDGKWRKVDIKLKRPSSERLQVRTREGYFAPLAGP
jgi:Ca-activated chloride channel family protein